MRAYCEQIGEDDGECRLEATVDDGSDATEQNPRPFGAVQLDEAPEARVRLADLLQQILLRADEVREGRVSLAIVFAVVVLLLGGQQFLAHQLRLQFVLFFVLCKGRSAFLAL